MKTISALIVLITLLAVAKLLTSGKPPTESDRFTSLSDLPGGCAWSKAYGISADGTAVVGHSNSATGMEAFRWTKELGMVGLGFPQANAISADGSVVVGYQHIDKLAEPVRWIHRGGIFGLGSLPRAGNGEATGVSADGSVIVGRCASDLLEGDNSGLLWSKNDGVKFLHHLRDEVPRAEAWAVSANGAVVVGACEFERGRSEAFRFSTEGGMTRLGVLSGDYDSVAYAVSIDGSVIVGVSTCASVVHAFRWTEATGMVDLGTPPDGSCACMSSGVSADGSVIVGQCHGAAGFEAFIWDAVSGLRSVRQILESEFDLGTQLRGWKLRAATGVSADGTVVVGYGVNPQGNQEAWLAFLGDEHRPVVLAADTRAVAVARSHK